MALAIARNLCSSNLMHRVSLARAVAPQMLARTVSLKSVQAPSVRAENHDERNMRLHRPLAPHLSIYKFELPALLSGTHRATGFAMFLYSTTIAVCALTLPHEYSYYIDAIDSIGIPSPIILLCKYIIAFPVAYHSVNGLRHMIWDTGRCLAMKDVYKTGYAAMAISAILTGIMAIA